MTILFSVLAAFWFVVAAVQTARAWWHKLVADSYRKALYALVSTHTETPEASSRAHVSEPTPFVWDSTQQDKVN